MTYAAEGPSEGALAVLQVIYNKILMDFVPEMMGLMHEKMDFTLKMMDVYTENDDLMQNGTLMAVVRVDGQSGHYEVSHIKSDDGFHTKDDGLHSENAGFHTKDAGFHSPTSPRSPTTEVRFPLIVTDFLLKHTDFILKNDGVLFTK